MEGTRRNTNTQKANKKSEIIQTWEQTQLWIQGPRFKLDKKSNYGKKKLSLRRIQYVLESNLSVWIIATRYNVTPWARVI
jgi:hypothetical protein